MCTLLSGFLPLFYSFPFFIRKKNVSKDKCSWINLGKGKGEHLVSTLETTRCLELMLLKKEKRKREINKCVVDDNKDLRNKGS